MKTVLILGASSDIAQAIARLYAEKGYSIQLAGRSRERLQPVASDIIIRYQVPAEVYYFDAERVEEHAQFYQHLKSPADIVICVFGYLGDQLIAQQDWNECHRILNANYTGAVSILNHIANDMEQRKAGVIAGISSVAGDRGRQSNYFYGSAKAGFTAYLSGLRNRLFKSGVHVVTVKPGFVATKMTLGMPLPKPLTAKPEQVAKRIYNAVEKKRNVIYVLPIWRWIMLIITLIPEGIFKKLKL